MYLLCFMLMTRFRSVVVEPGKKTTFTAQADIRLTNATLDANLVDEKSRTSVKLIYETPSRIGEDGELEDEKSETSESAKTTTILCSLTPGKVCTTYSPCRNDHLIMLLTRLSKLLWTLFWLNMMKSNLRLLAKS